MIQNLLARQIVRGGNLALRTRGSRGAQFWFYATDDYPQEVRKFEVNGTTENAGEFRGGGCISIIWGVHENGNLYSRVNDVPPIKFAYNDVTCFAGLRVIEPKNNFKLSANGNRNTGPPTPTGRRGSRRVDWDKFNEALRNASGRAIVESLVKRWFGDAVVEGQEWSCGDITGRAQTGRGSFHISPRDFASISTGAGAEAVSLTPSCQTIAGI